MAKKKSFFKKILISLFFIFALLLGIAFYLAYQVVYQTNVSLGDKKSQIIYIKTGSSFNEVLQLLVEKKIIIHSATFEWLSERKKYKNNIKPGKYRILAKMGNNEIINLLRSGIQEPVEINFVGIRTPKHLISRVCNRLEADSIEFENKLGDDNYMKKFGLNSSTAMTLFIPNTYQFYWNTSVDQFLEKMAQEYKKVWTNDRTQKAKYIGFSQSEVTILASIVQSEQWRYNDEKRVIAGLYLNRLKKEMLLQSDPTVIYAINNFKVSRVLNIDKEVDSPYNTYKYKGLPPGPICLPEISSIDAVLNYDQNNYLYMCAKEDFSGRHYFTSSYQQHLIYAQRYRQALDQKGIIR